MGTNHVMHPDNGSCREEQEKIVVNLAMALVWLISGLCFLVLSWTQTDWDPRSLDQMRLFGWVALALAVYNVVRWRMGVLIRKARRDQEFIDRHRPAHWRRTEQLEEFDFSDSRIQDARNQEGDAKQP